MVKFEGYLGKSNGKWKKIGEIIWFGKSEKEKCK